MTSKHKQSRIKARFLWRKIKKSKNKVKFIKPGNYQKLKIYEKKKAVKFRKTKKQKGQKDNKQKTVEHNRVPIVLNKNIDFEKNIEAIVDITNKINNFMSKSLTLDFYLDHKKIENISIAGLLYLVGQISKLTFAKFKDGKHHLKYNKKFGLHDNTKIKHLFNEIGYWKYFGIKKPYKIDNDIKENYFLSIQTSNQSDFTLLNEIKSFINKNVVFLQDNYGLEYQFDDAIKEAMGNSIEHAYPDNFSELGKQKGKWWICGHYDKKNNSIELVFYDYGIGIRNSMKYNLGEDADIVFLDRMKDASIRSDADLIEMAINGDLPKYKNYSDHDRGKGFKRFKNFAKASGFDCELTIVSNNGKYKLRYNSETKKEAVDKSKLSGSIDGMLIKWKINLNTRNDYE